MRTAETVSGLTEFARRGAGSDSERRAAMWLGRELATSGRDVSIEPFWCRPNWAFAQSWHVFLGTLGSLISVGNPRVGGVMMLIALLSLLSDAMLGISPGRRLTPERASQNVVARSEAGVAGFGAGGQQQVTLVVTANYDAGRAALAYRTPLRAAAARLRSIPAGVTLGWFGWVALALCWLLAVAIFRLEGSHGTVIGVAQLIPTVGLVLTLALLIEAGTADFGPAAGDNGSGVAVALALARALDAAPPRRVAVEVVLQGAGDGSGIGLRRYQRAHRSERQRTNTIVLGVSACSAGTPRWWTSDGPLIPLRYFARLRQLCAGLVSADSGLDARPQRGRGLTPAFAARLSRIPAITIGCLDEGGLVPRSHQPTDTPEALDPGAMDAALEFALALVDAIDADLGRGAAGRVAVGAG